MTLDRNTLLEAAKIARESYAKESDYDAGFKIAAHSIAGTLERLAAAQPDITQMIHDAGGDMEKVHAILAAQPDTVCVPRTVWQVSSKTAILLFSTEADADVFIASHPPSVSGGMFKKEVPVHYAAGGKR